MASRLSILVFSPGNGHRGGRERHPGPEHEEAHQTRGQSVRHQSRGSIPGPFFLFFLAPSRWKQRDDITKPSRIQAGGVGGTSGLHQTQPPKGGGNGRGQYN